MAATPVDELGMAHGLPVAFEAVQRGVKCGLGAVSTTYHRAVSEGPEAEFLAFRIVCQSMVAICSAKCAPRCSLEEVNRASPDSHSHNIIDHFQG